MVPSVQFGPEPPPKEKKGRVTHIHVHFTISMANVTRHLDWGSLLDRGANVGLVTALQALLLRTYPNISVSITGIEEHQMNGLSMCDAAAVMETNRGPVIGLMQQYAWCNKGRSIHSCCQMEHFGNLVEDRSMKVGGRQCIRTHDGYLIPVDVIGGLVYLKMHKPTQEEMDTLPHVALTAPGPWNPRNVDHIITDIDEWKNVIADLDEGLIQTPFDEFGNYRKREPERHSTILTYEDKDPDDDESYDPNDDDSDDSSFGSVDSDFQVHVHKLKMAYHQCQDLNHTWINVHEVDEETVTTANETEVSEADSGESEDEDTASKESESDSESSDIEADSDDDTAELIAGGPRIGKRKKFDYDKYRPYFLHVPREVVQKTFERTTQMGANIMSGVKIQQTIKSPYPALNVWRRNEPVATDTVFAQTPAIDCGHTMAQIFVGRKSKVIDVYGMSTEAQFVNTLEDNIRKRGAMDKLLTDSARVEMSRRVKDILRMLLIDDWASEAWYHQQLGAEGEYKHCKKNTFFVMNFRDVPGYGWLLCLQWVADVMNHTARKSLGWRPPLEVLTGQTVDISIILCFMFWDVVYVSRLPDDHYKSSLGNDQSDEIRCRFVGFAWDVGHAFTFKVLTEDTRRVIHRSRLRLANVMENNLKLDRAAGAVPERVYLHSKRDEEGDKMVLPTIDLTLNPFLEDDEETPRTRSKGKIHQADVQVETVQEEEEDSEQVTSESGETEIGETEELFPDPPTPGYHSPMDDVPLKDAPVVDGVDDDEYLAPHLREADQRTDPDEPLDLGLEYMEAANPVEHGLEPEDMIGRTFLMPPEEDGTRVRAKIMERIKCTRKELAKNPELIKFRALVNDQYEEIIAHHHIREFIEKDESWEGVWHFKEILAHEGPLRQGDKRYKGSRYNVLILWETNEKTWEPLTTKDKDGIWESDPVTVAIYAKKHGLLKTPGWMMKGLRKMAKTEKRLIRIAKQAKLTSWKTKMKYQYGFLVPNTYEQALQLDKENGNTKWQDCTLLELNQQAEYSTFRNKGRDWTPEQGFKKINVHLVYAVKHDGRHKARLVAGGHLTGPPLESVYSSVVSLRGIRMISFLAELNKMELWSTDIGNAYLESYTKEKVYIIAGPEFGEMEGCKLVIQKALYGLKSSGLRWHERFADVLRQMGFTPSKAENDIWMRDKGDHYEYIAVYVDDLMIASRNAQSIIDVLTKEHKFQLKGTGAVSFHLGCDFFRDSDGVLCYAPRKYIEKCLDNYKTLFGVWPKKASSPLVKGDHPELDSSPLLGLEEQRMYQSLIGSLQWSIQIGRFDVGTATMTMSRFRAAPRKGHMDRVKRIFGYLRKMKHGVIKIRTDEPDYSSLENKEYDWFYTCYHGATEELPTDAPRPLGKRVIISSFVDANLYHDLISGKAVTGILHMFNKTPIDWFTKLQSTVETATFGSEYVAARTCTEQIIDLRLTLRYLGVPVEGASYMFGDNETVVNTAAQPHGKLHKRHNALSYHKTRASIAAGITRFHHVRGDTNPADILSKHWDAPSVWTQLRPLLFWIGDTGDLVEDDEEDDEESNEVNVVEDPNAAIVPASK